MTRPRPVLPFLVLAAIAGLTACGGGSSKSAGDVAAAISSAVSGAAATTSAGDLSAVATPTDTSSTAPVSSPASTVPAGGVGVRPDSDESKTLVYLLEAIDPGMGTDANGLIGKSVTVCQHILGGDSAGQVNAVIQQQFTNGSYVPRGEQLTAIDLAMTQIFCR